MLPVVIRSIGSDPAVSMIASYNLSAVSSERWSPDVEGGGATGATGAIGAADAAGFGVAAGFGDDARA